MSNEFNEHFTQGPQQDIANTGSLDSADSPDLTTHPGTDADKLVDGRDAGSIPWAATMPAMASVNRDESTGELFGGNLQRSHGYYCDDNTLFIYDLED